MSRATTPFGAMFQMQRRSLEQGQRAFERGLEMQRQMADAVVDGMDAGRSTQKKGVEVARSATDAYFDAVAATMPGDAAAVERTHEAVDDQFEAFDALHTQVWDAVQRTVTGNADALDDVEESYRSAVLESMDVAIEASRRMEEQSAAAAEAVEPMEIE